MENLESLNSKQLVSRLYQCRPDVSPESKVTPKVFTTATSASYAVKGKPDAAYAIVPKGEKAIAILVREVSDPPDTFHVIFDERRKVPGKVASYLRRGKLKDIYNLFRALNNTYGKTYWELHEIDPGQQADESVAEEAQAPVMNRRDQVRRFTDTSRLALRERLEAYRKAKIPDANKAADVLALIQANKKLPASFIYNGLRFDLSNSYFEIDPKTGQPHAPVSSDMLAGLVYRADIDDYLALALDEEDALPKYIEVHYDMKKGSFVPSTVMFKS